MISAHRRGWGQVAVRCNRLCYCIRGLPLSQAASPFYGTLPRFGGAFSCVFPPALCATNGAAGRWGCGFADTSRPERRQAQWTATPRYLAGLFHAGPPRVVQPTSRLGVEFGRLAVCQCRPTSPAPTRGFCLATPSVGCPAVGSAQPAGPYPDCLTASRLS